jgi:hypothetical protein
MARLKKMNLMKKKNGTAESYLLPQLDGIPVVVHFAFAPFSFKKNVFV